MQVTKAIKKMIVNRDAKHIDVSEKLGYTKQGFSNLLKKDNYKLDDIPIPDELIICLSEPWVPYSYRPLFYLLMDYCNDKFDTHYNILMDRCTQ